MSEFSNPEDLPPSLMPILSDIQRICDDLMYHTPRNFQENSTLLAYLRIRCPSLIKAAERNYVLFDIITAVKKAVADFKLFDPQNPEIILCDPFMDEVFGCEAFHVDDLRVHVLRHLEPIPVPRSPRRDSAVRHTSEYPKPTFPSWGSPEATAVKAKVLSNNTYFHKQCHYKPSPALKAVLQTVDTSSYRGDLYMYHEVLNLVSKYISSKKDLFVDPRNSKIVIIEGDLLEDALCVKAFAKTQQVSLVQLQLKPAQPPLPRPVDTAYMPEIYPPFIIILRDPTTPPPYDSLSSDSDNYETDRETDRETDDDEESLDVVS